METVWTGGIMGVTRLDGRILRNDRPNPMTRRLHDAYWEHRKRGWCSEPIDYALAQVAGSGQRAAVGRRVKADTVLHWRF